MLNEKRTVALASGGLDSSTTMALAQKQGFEAHALSLDYGQRHRYELNAARAYRRNKAPLSQNWLSIQKILRASDQRHYVNLIGFS